MNDLCELQRKVIQEQQRIIEAQRVGNFYVPKQMVYFAYSPRLHVVKVGSTQGDIHRRLKEHRNTAKDEAVEVIFYTEGYRELERYTHRLLKDHRYKLRNSYEWFNAEPVFEYLKDQYDFDYLATRRKAGRPKKI